MQPGRAAAGSSGQFLFATVAATLAAVSVAGACGGGSSGSKADAAQPGPDGGGVGSDGGAPPDIGPAMTKRLVPGQAHIVGTPNTACSTPLPGGAAPLGDHWCAFTLPSKESLGSTELWAIDVEASLAGTVVCDGTDAHCVRVTTNLFTAQPKDGGPQHPFSHHFYGQTLIFYVGPATTTPFSGPVMGWRPGWAKPAQLTSDLALSCDGFAASDIGLCFDNEGLSANPPHFDVRAGRLSDKPLPVVGTIYPRTATNASSWSVAFSPAGDYFAYSSNGPAATDVETLYAYKIDDTHDQTKRITVATGVSVWDIAPDGKHWYFMRNYNYPPVTSTTDPNGNLAVADFPGGGNEIALAMNVGSYVFLGSGGVDRGVALLDGVKAGKGTLKVIADASKPTAVTTVADGVIDALPSDDGRYVFIKTDVDPNTELSNAQVVKTDGTGNCTLAAGRTTDLFGAAFLPHAGLAFWGDNINPTTGDGQAFRANPNGCGDKQMFADQIALWFPAGDRGLIFSDAYGATTTRLRFVKIGPNAEWPAAGPTTISDNVQLVFGLLEPDRQYVVYEIAGDMNTGGLWVYGPIGFGQ